MRRRTRRGCGAGSAQYTARRASARALINDDGPVLPSAIHFPPSPSTANDNTIHTHTRERHTNTHRHTDTQAHRHRLERTHCSAVNVRRGTVGNRPHRGATPPAATAAAAEPTAGGERWCNCGECDDVRVLNGVRRSFVVAAASSAPAPEQPQLTAHCPPRGAPRRPACLRQVAALPAAARPATAPAGTVQPLARSCTGHTNSVSSPSLPLGVLCERQRSTSQRHTGRCEREQRYRTRRRRGRRGECGGEGSEHR